MPFNTYIENDTLLAYLCPGPIDIVKLVSFLQNSTYVTKLNLTGLKIGNEGLKELAKLTHLTSLNLRENNISDKGIEELAKLTKLTSLDLADNNIRKEGAEALANSPH